MTYFLHNASGDGCTITRNEAKSLLRGTCTKRVYRHPNGNHHIATFAGFVICVEKLQVLY